MKKVLKEIYLENKEVIEITAIVFIITSLMININPTDELVKHSINQINFLLLAVSAILVIYLLFQTGVVLIRRWINFGEQFLGQGKDDRDQWVNVNMMVIPIAFLFLLSFIFLLNLINYITLTFTRESIFLLLTVSSYVVLFLFSLAVPSNKRMWIQNIYAVIYIILAVILLLLFPVYIYLKTISWI